MAVYDFRTIIFSSIILLLIVQKTTISGLDLAHSGDSIEELGSNKLSEGIQNNDIPTGVTEQHKHSRVKRQFGFGPYSYYGPGYYRRPIPIIVGGFGIGAPIVFGGGFGPRGFGGFGPRGFGGRGFGGRGFGGRGFGGRGFGGRGFGGRGFGGRGFGGRGIGGRGGFGGRGGRG